MGERCKQELTHERARHPPQASKDCTARVWSAATGGCLATCEGHVEAVGSLAFLKKKAMILTGSRDKTLKLWDLSCISAKKGKPRAAVSAVGHTKDINALAIAPSDRMAASGSQVSEGWLGPWLMFG